jgi:Glycosyl transferase family 2
MQTRRTSAPPRSIGRPLVSVLIPVHNGENYIVQAIESVLSQDVAPIELLVVDDASTDRTAEIVRGYGTRVTYMPVEKQSCHIAVMNIGLERVTGEYVAVLHHDDYFLPGKLRRGIELMEADADIGMTYSSFWFVGPSGQPLNRFRSRVGRDDYVVDGNVELRYEAVQNHMHFGNVLLRRSALKSIGPFDETLALTSEWGWWMRLLLKYRVGYVGEPLFCYRLHPGAFTFTGSRDTSVWDSQAMAIVDGFYADPGVSPEIRRRRDLSVASVNLTVGLLRIMRREWRPGFGSMRAALAGAGVRRLPDLLKSTAIGPRFYSRARMLASRGAARIPAARSGQAIADAGGLRCPRCGGISGYPAWAPPWHEGPPRMGCVACGERWQAPSSI